MRLRRLLSPRQRFRPANLIQALADGEAMPSTREILGHFPYVITLQMQLKRCGHGKKLIIQRDSSADTTNPDTALIKLITRAHMWFEEMKIGLSFKEIAEKENVDQRLVTRTIQCALPSTRHHISVTQRVRTHKPLLSEAPSSPQPTC